MRILFVLAAWLLLATVAPPRLHRLPAPPADPGLNLSPVSLQPGTAKHRIGKLVYLGGWHLQSDDYRFGGISAMHVDQLDVLAVSDAGILFRFPRPDLASPLGISILPLPEAPGSPTRKSDRDSESMVVEGEHLWIGFERTNQVWRYSRSDFAKESAAAPQAMRRWRANSGSEAMVRLKDGRFLIFSEGGGKGGLSEVLLFEGDPAEPGATAVPLRYRPPEGYRITDAGVLPDGRLVFLNRRFAWLEGMSAKIGVSEVPALTPGIVLEGEQAAEIRAPLTTDNFEALSVSEEKGRTIVWLASDDNYNPLQRTLLMKFMLAEGEERR